MKKNKLFILAMVMCLSFPIWGQNPGIKITGHVYDLASKTPLSGVNIYIGGTKIGTITDTVGFFTLRVKTVPVILFFSYVGYEVKQYQVKPIETKQLDIYLKAETQEIGEVTISGERIMNLFKGDTLNVVDYEIYKDQIIMVANPYKSLDDQRLYLTSLSGEILTSKKITHAGHMVDIPESIDIKNKIYLFKDCFKTIQLLTIGTVYQIQVDQNQLQLLYPTRYDDFYTLLFPAKASLNGHLFYQNSTMNTNDTYSIETIEKKYKPIKRVVDPFGQYRYARPIDFPDGLTPASEYIIPNSYERSVTVPVVQRADEIAVFDFFGNTLDFFNANGDSLRSVAISFHLKEYYEFTKKKVDIDLDNFSQKILYDDKADKIWAVFHGKSNGRFSLKEINPDTGEVMRMVFIPDYPFIDKIRIFDNTVYFMYLQKVYPFYRSLYRMNI